MYVYVAPGVAFDAAKDFGEVVVDEWYVDAIGFAFEVKRVVRDEIVAIEDGCGVGIVVDDSATELEASGVVVEIARCNSGAKVGVVELEIGRDDIGIDFGQDEGVGNGSIAIDDAAKRDGSFFGEEFVDIVERYVFELDVDNFVGRARCNAIDGNSAE